MKLYSTGCPKCKILEKKMQSLGLDFTLVDNEEEVMKVAAEHNLQSAPFLIDGDKVMEFSEAYSYVGGLSCK